MQLAVRKRTLPTPPEDPELLSQGGATKLTDAPPERVHVNSMLIFPFMRHCHLKEKHKHTQNHGIGRINTLSAYWPALWPPVISHAHRSPVTFQQVDLVRSPAPAVDTQAFQVWELGFHHLHQLLQGVDHLVCARARRHVRCHAYMLKREKHAFPTGYLGNILYMLGCGLIIDKQYLMVISRSLETQQLANCCSVSFHIHRC